LRGGSGGKIEEGVREERGVTRGCEAQRRSSGGWRERRGWYQLWGGTSEGAMKAGEKGLGGGAGGEVGKEEREVGGEYKVGKTMEVW